MQTDVSELRRGSAFSKNLGLCAGDLLLSWAIVPPFLYPSQEVRSISLLIKKKSLKAGAELPVLLLLFLYHKHKPQSYKTLDFMRYSFSQHKDW